jgi:hypothetical protein
MRYDCITAILGGEFGGGREKIRGREFAGIQRLRQSGTRFGNALAAAGSHAELTGQITHTGSAIFDGGFDMTVRNSFANANNHGAYLERECE